MRWRLAAPPIPGLLFGKRCARCGARTDRQRTPLLLRPVRALSGNRLSVRLCLGCRRYGIALHGAGEPHRVEAAR